MTDRETLLALADRVEKATGPDRELDLELAVRVNYKGMFDDLTAIYQWGAGGDEIDCHYPPKNGKPSKGYLDPAQFCPRFSASLDAAMTLVPEGWEPIIDCRRTVEVQLETIAVDPETLDPRKVYATAATPALALCAAALRALATLDPTGEKA